MLKFAPANAKLKKLQQIVGGKVYTFSLLAGHTCPMANECHSRVEKVNGVSKIVDGKNTVYRCFAASLEVIFPRVYASDKHNTDMIKSCGNNVDKMVDMIQSSLPKKARYIRIHVSGDMMTLNYFKAWVTIAKKNPNIGFYAYTKSIGMWVKLMDSIPDNMILTASRGGIQDNLIDEYKLREAVVVFSEDEATDMGYDIDHDDTHAALSRHKNESFALLIHGIQPAGSKASIAKEKLNGSGSYSREKALV